MKLKSEAYRGSGISFERVMPSGYILADTLNLGRRIHALADTKAGAFREIKRQINSQFYGVGSRRYKIY